MPVRNSIPIANGLALCMQLLVRQITTKHGFEATEGR